MARDQARNGTEPIRITTAGSNRADDIALRQKRYLISMSIRSICFIGAVTTAMAGITWLWPWLIGAALILPYIAVVLANNSTTRSDGFELMDRGAGRPELTPSADSERHSGQNRI